MNDKEIKRYIFDNLETLNIEVDRIYENEEDDFDEDYEEEDCYKGERKYVYLLTVKKNDKERGYEFQFYEEDLTNEEMLKLDKYLSYFHIDE